MREPTFFARPWLQFSLAVLIGALLGVIGPFGSFGRLDIERRVVQWVVLVALNWGFVLAASRLVLAAPAIARLPPAGQAVAAALAAAVPGSVATATLVGLWEWSPVDRPPPFAEMLFYVAAINVAISVPLRFVVHSLGSAIPETAPLPEAGRAEALFLRRLPPRLGRELLAVEAEDHYLRVHTRLGSDLILMRMADAEAELVGLNGARTHRSWWVARSAVMRAERQGQAVRFELTNGLSVPVSRANATHLRRAGWF